MLKFYYSLAPNPMKVALFLEESGLPYEAIPVETRKGEQHAPEFRAINPNSKVPAIVDGDVAVFDSTAILLYLGEKTGKFMPPAAPAARAQLLSWMLFVGSGLGPFCGQAVHFERYAPESVPYAKKRYTFEAMRHLKILDERLATHRYMLGDVYTIADMNVWGWARLAPFVLADDNAFASLPHLKRLIDEVTARPAAQRALAIKERHAFKTEMDDEARRAMFPHLAA
jgi:GST-like protein